MTDDSFQQARRRLEHRAAARTFTISILMMFPVGLMGNFASEFFKTTDTLHMLLAVAGAASLLGAYFLLWPVRLPSGRS